MCQNHVYFWGNSTSLYTEVSVTWGSASVEMSSLGRVLFPTLCIILSMSLKGVLKNILQVNQLVRCQKTRVLGKCSRTKSYLNPSLGDPRQASYHWAHNPNPLQQACKVSPVNIYWIPRSIHHSGFSVPGVLGQLLGGWGGALPVISSLVECF